MKLGFASSNYVARASRYDATLDWEYHRRKTVERFHIGNLSLWLEAVHDAGFDGMSLWAAHAWPESVSPQQAEAIQQMARRMEMPIYACDGAHPLPDERSEHGWERVFRMAEHAGAGWITGRFTSVDALPLIRHCVKQTGVKFALVNTTESRPQELRDQIEGYEDTVGLSFDTAAATLAGMDVPTALRKLAPLLMEVRLRDVRKNDATLSCALGDGRVPVRACVDVLRQAEYDGWVTVVHQPFDRDPLPELELSVRRVREWFDMPNVRSHSG